MSFKTHICTKCSTGRNPTGNVPAPAPAREIIEILDSDDEDPAPPKPKPIASGLRGFPLPRRSVKREPPPRCREEDGVIRILSDSDEEPTAKSAPASSNPPASRRPELAAEIDCPPSAASPVGQDGNSSRVTPPPPSAHPPDPLDDHEAATSLSDVEMADDAALSPSAPEEQVVADILMRDSQNEELEPEVTGGTKDEPDANGNSLSEREMTVEVARIPSPASGESMVSGNQHAISTAYHPKQPNGHTGSPQPSSEALLSPRNKESPVTSSAAPLVDDRLRVETASPVSQLLDPKLQDLAISTTPPNNTPQAQEESNSGAHTPPLGVSIQNAIRKVH